MLIVGASSIWAPLALASSPRNLPTFRSSVVLKVAPRAVPQGRHAAGLPLKNVLPRTPLGPSERRNAGTPSRGIGTVCQKSLPRLPSTSITRGE